MASVHGTLTLLTKSLEVGESQLGEHLKQKYLPGELFDTFTIACFDSPIFRWPHWWNCTAGIMVKFGVMATS